MHLNPPPNWPPVPRGWTPPPGWQPDPSWGPPPPNWPLWVPNRSKNRTALIVGGAIAAVTAIAVVIVLAFTVWSTSDESEIRAAVSKLEDAYNSSNLQAFGALVCKQDQQLVEGMAKGDGFGAKSGTEGRSTLTVNSIKINGDRATVNITTKSERTGKTETDDVTFVREGGDWKACLSDDSGSKTSTSSSIPTPSR
jgi:hypothetical protein